eukprot:GHVT01067981.1.p1 GENE.GHVT01067981.1~~GHVT01067981.1.p1  ORF type:complete len:186 (-),score=1.65 GHVT01067981.1:92-610(-)
MTEIVTLRAIFLSYYCLHADNQDLRDVLGRIVAAFFDKGTSLRFLDINGFYAYHVFAWRTSSRTLSGRDLFAYGNRRPLIAKVVKNEACRLISADARPYCWGGFNLAPWVITSANRARLTRPLADRSTVLPPLTRCEQALEAMDRLTAQEQANFIRQAQAKYNTVVFGELHH